MSDLVQRKRQELAKAENSFWKSLGKALLASGSAGLAMFHLLQKAGLSLVASICGGVAMGLLPAVIVGYLWYRLSRPSRRR